MNNKENNQQGYLPPVNLQDVELVKIGGVPQLVRVGYPEYFSHPEMIKTHERLMNWVIENRMPEDESLSEKEWEQQERDSHAHG